MGFDGDRMAITMNIFFTAQLLLAAFVDLHE